MVKTIYVVGLVVVLLLIANVATVLALTWPVTEFSISKAGSFGDSFGWLNAVFSGFAFLGVAWALLLQREELKDSREATRLERFEGSFFRLLDLLRKNLEEIRVPTPDGGQPIFGVEALGYCSRKVQESMEEHKKWLRTPNGRLIYEQLLQRQARCMAPQARYLGTMETLLELIERDLPSDSRAPYWDILAQQLTSSEAKYLLLWAIRGSEADRLSQLITRAEPLLKRVAALSSGSSIRSLFFRLYGVRLEPPAKNFPAVFSKSQYKEIRFKARFELDQLEREEARLNARKAG